MTRSTEEPGASGRQRHGLAPGMLAARDRLAAAMRLHPRLADAALAAVLLALSVPPFTSLAGGNRALSLALVVATVSPLAWRRRAPSLVLVIIAGPALVELFTGRQLTDYLALLVAFYTVAAYSARWRALAAAVLLEAGAVLAVSHMRTPGAHRVLVWVIASCLIAAAGLVGYYIGATRRAHAAALADRAERAERERQHEVELAASAERARIAREMHDIVAHNIAVMIALAEGAAYAKDPDQSATLMEQISATGRTALTEMRRLLGVLREPTGPGHAPQPTLADVNGLLATVRAAGLAADLTVSGRPFPLPPSAELALYRIIQEALTNTLKHAVASSAQVHLIYRSGVIIIDVTDDGRPGGTGAGSGPDAGHTAGGQRIAGSGDGIAGSGHGIAGSGHGIAGSGHGIAGMRERAALFDGQVSAGPRPGGGWRVHAVMRVGTAGDQGPAADQRPASDLVPSADAVPAGSDRGAAAESA
jgi:signal transduction histidine kinase